MMRWATFDCYGTLIDWNTGIAKELGRLFPNADTTHLLARYHEVEAAAQRDNASTSYRDILSLSLTQLAEDETLELPKQHRDALALALPGWEPFPDTRLALSHLRDQGWRLAILSNTDPDLIEASKERIGVPFEETVVASEIRSYKPSHRHWEEFLERTGASRDRHVHVAASLFHDIAPCVELGLTSVWINREGEEANPRPTRELPDLTKLPEILEELVPAQR